MAENKLRPKDATSAAITKPRIKDITPPLHVEVAEAERDQLRRQMKEMLSAYKVWRNATESRLKMLNGREALDTMIPADRALIEAFDQVRKELGE